MTFQEATENDYTIFVASSIIAEQLKKKFKYRKFKSIHSKCVDGLRRVYIDESIKWMSEAKQIERIVKPFEIIYGNIPPA